MAGVGCRPIDYAGDVKDGAASDFVGPTAAVRRPDWGDSHAATAYGLNHRLPVIRARCGVAGLGRGAGGYAGAVKEGCRNLARERDSDDAVDKLQCDSRAVLRQGHPGNYSQLLLDLLSIAVLALLDGTLGQRSNLN